MSRLLEHDAMKTIIIGAAVGFVFGSIALLIGGERGHTLQFMRAVVPNIAVATLGGAVTGLFVARTLNQI